MILAQDKLILRILKLSFKILNSSYFILKSAQYGPRIPKLVDFKDKGPQRCNLCGLEPQLIKLEFIIYLPKLKVSMGPTSGLRPLVLGARHLKFSSNPYA